MTMNFKRYSSEKLDKMTAEMEEVLKSKGVTKREFVRYGTLAALGVFYAITESGKTNKNAVNALLVMLEITDREWEEE